MKGKFFDIYIITLLKNIKKDKGIHIDAKNMINNLLILLVNEISKKCYDMMCICNKKTLSVEDLLIVSRLILDVHLYNKCIDKFNIHRNIEKTRQKYSTVVFPILLIEKMIRYHLIDINLSCISSLCLTVIIECIAIEILTECCINNVDKKVRLTVKDIEHTRNNKCLNNLYTKYNIYFIESIKKNVNNLNLVIPKITFERKVRFLLTSLTDKKIKLSKDFCYILQSIIEQYIINFMKKINVICTHANRITVMTSDITIIQNLVGHQH